MKGRMIHSVAGELTSQPYGTSDSQVINSVSRAELNRILLDGADSYDNVNLFFEHRCQDVDLAAGRVSFEKKSGERIDVEGDLVLGADGAYSRVRRRMQRSDRFNYSQDYLEHGYQELVIPPAADGGFRIEPNALHIWPRGGFMMIALPNADGSFTCTLFWPLEGEFSFGQLTNEKQVLDFFERWFADAIPHMPTLVEDYLSASPSSLVTVRCFPWAVEDKVALLGDACHAVVPFYGQGMNCAFEDCTVLDQCIEKHSRNEETHWGEALREYQDSRKENAEALADLAIENFLEMRDKVGSKWFLFKKKAGKFLHKLAPNFFVPAYSMVTFSNMPYAEAQRRALEQTRFLRRSAAAFLVLLIGLMVVFLWRSR